MLEEEYLGRRDETVKEYSGREKNKPMSGTTQTHDMTNIKKNDNWDI